MKSGQGVIPESNAASLRRFPASFLYFGLSSLTLRASVRFSRRLSTSLLCSWCLDSASLIWLIMLSSAFRRESIISLSLVLTEMMALVARLSSVTFSCICFSWLGISASDLTIRLKSYPLTSRLMWQSSDGGKMMHSIKMEIIVQDVAYKWRVYIRSDDDFISEWLTAINNSMHNLTNNI